MSARTKALALGLVALAVPALLLATSPAAAKKGNKVPEPDDFTAFEEELLQTSGFDEDDATALKQMRRCHAFDQKWQRQLDDPTNYSLEATRDVVRISVICWEKVGKKHPTGHGGIDGWIGAWHRFLQGTEMWLNAQEARQEVDRDRFCTRIDASLEMLGDAVVQGEALPPLFSVPETLEMASRPLQAASQLRGAASELRETVGCQ